MTDFDRLIEKIGEKAVANFKEGARHFLMEVSKENQGRSLEISKIEVLCGPMYSPLIESGKHLLNLNVKCFDFGKSSAFGDIPVAEYFYTAKFKH